jgi:hypothetical protein
MFGVLQRLSIIEQSSQRLVLRELPLMEWLFAGALFLTAINLAFFDLWITAMITVVIALAYSLQTRLRLIVFDVASGTIQVWYQYPLKQKMVNQERLDEISRAYLSQDDTGATQIVLVKTNGLEMGLSVYSQDVKNWKEVVVIAINAILHEAHRDDDDKV